MRTKQGYKGLVLNQENDRRIKKSYIMTGFMIWPTQQDWTCSMHGMKRHAHH